MQTPAPSRRRRLAQRASYVFPSIPLGRYTLRVTKEGFKSFEAKDVVLHVADSLTVDARLDVGAKSETIESGRQPRRKWS